MACLPACKRPFPVRPAGGDVWCGKQRPEATGLPLQQTTADTNSDVRLPEDQPAGAGTEEQPAIRKAGILNEPSMQAVDTVPSVAKQRQQAGAVISNDDFRQESHKKKLRIVICSAQENLGQYLSRLLESYGFEVVQLISLVTAQILSLDANRFDVLLVDRPETGSSLSAPLAEIFARWNGPLVFNDSKTTETCLHNANPEFGAALARQITALADSTRGGPTVINL